jgi:hypothetical protein
MVTICERLADFFLDVPPTEATRPMWETLTFPHVLDLAGRRTEDV